LSEDKTQIAEHFGNAPYFYIATRQKRDGALLSEAFHYNPFSGAEKGKGIKVSEWLLEKGVDVVHSPKGFEWKGPGYVFSDAGVEVMKTGGNSLQDIQKDFHETGKLPDSSGTWRQAVIMQSAPYPP
jgi:predicted Fe-Mo cluster-binding NifX family protein